MIKQLRQFYCSDGQDIFQDAEFLPQFFSDNLVDPNRVVKYFQNDPQANLRIFYYQYLKLCFEIDNVDYESYIDKIYELIRSDQFCFTFQQNDRNINQKNVQFKTLMIDFFDIMNSGSITIDLALNQYPILDEVFTNFFRTITMLAGVAEDYNSYIQKRPLFQFLTSYFSVDISSYDKCLKFVQSDIFVYQQDPQHIYMAFIKDDETVNQSFQQNSSINNQNLNSYYSSSSNNINEISQNIPSESKLINSQSHIGQNLNVKAKTIIKESYIQSQFADYTQYKPSNNQFSSNTLESLAKNQMKSSSFQQDESVFKGIVQEKKTQIEDHSEQTQQNTKQMFFTDQKLEKQLKKSSSGIIKKQLITKQMSMPNFHSKQTQVYSELPTKDPGFQIKITKVDQNSYMAKKNYFDDTPIVTKSIQQQKPSQSKYIQRENSSKFAINSNNNKPFDSNYIYNGGNSNSTKFQSNKIIQNKKIQSVPSYNQKQVAYQSNKPSYSSSYKPLIQSKPYKNDKFGLNVTKQFTSSIVMKIMKEPYKSNTYQIRQKARMYRKSLYSYIQ